MSISLPRVGKFSATIALNLLSVPFSFSCSGIPIESCESLRIFFTLCHFICLFSDWIISYVLLFRSLILWSSWLNLLSKLSIEYFSSIIIFFNSRISLYFCFFFSWLLFLCQTSCFIHALFSQFHLIVYVFL